MGFYQDEIVPILINLTMRRRDLSTYRSRVVPSADGRVLEIGIGSGLNLPFYSRNVKYLIGLEPSPRLLSMVRRNLGSDTPRPELIEGSAEAIPLETHSFDTVVTTWTLCSIPDAALAVREMRRVLRSTGRNGGGWHLNRPIQKLIEDGGFQFDRLETGYMRGPKPLAFMYEGSARPR